MLEKIKEIFKKEEEKPTAPANNEAPRPMNTNVEIPINIIKEAMEQAKEEYKDEKRWRRKLGSNRNFGGHDKERWLKNRVMEIVKEKGYKV